MIFTHTEIEGVVFVDIEPIGDHRGFFARSWCRREFAERSLADCVVQANVAFTPQCGTLRGLHYQAAPFPEAKLVRCVRGAAYVVAVDIRPDSPTFTHWVGVELTADNRRMLSVPPGCAQGYQTLAAETEMFYQVSAFYVPQAARGIRHDDPAFGIRWPLEVRNLSPRDASWPSFVIREPSATSSTDSPRMETTPHDCQAPD